MARWAPERRDTIRSLAEELLQLYPHGRVVVGVDGDDPTLSGPVADDLATELRTLDHDVFRASLGDFRLPRAQGGYDYSAFRRVLLGPFRLAGSTGFSTAFFDAARDVTFESRWQTGPADAILVVDGPDLLDSDVKGVWNFSVRLEHGPQASPRSPASATVDVEDPEHPRRIFADSC